MRLRRLISAEGALILGGLGIVASGAAIDAWATTAGLIGAGQPGHDDLLAYNMPVVGLAFIAFGLVMAQAVLFLRRGYRRVYLASMLLIADGVAHTAALGAHVAEPVEAAFFTAAAAVLILAGLTLPESTRKLRDLWIAMSLGLIALFFVSRATAVPYVFGREPVDGLGVVSKILEVLLILVLLSMRPATFDEGLRAAVAQVDAQRELATTGPG